MTRRYKTGRGKQDQYFAEVQSLYLAGKTLKELQELYSISLSTLKRWHKEGRWEQKKQQAMISPRWLAEALRGVLREKTGRVLAAGDLKPQDLEELTKIVTLIDRLGHSGWDLKAAALEVMDRFSEFIRGWVKEPEEIKRFSLWLQEFFRTLEEEDGRG
jgi:transposase|uniref:Uncharacterized protein n=1 Tax=Desulfobacca acetoxidans TaxID=60893 RepID=A0A7C5AK75_9BACT